MKSVRFTALVDAFGSPEPITLWTAPDKDPGISRAAAENRIVTLLQPPRGHRADYGLVGLHPQEHATFVRFPKAIPYAKGTRIIGIKYQLITNPLPVLKAGPPRAPRQSKAASEKKPRDIVFRAVIQFTATQEVSFEIRASNRRAARQTALDAAAKYPPECSHAQIRRQLIRLDSHSANIPEKK